MSFNIGILNGVLSHLPCMNHTDIESSKISHSLFGYVLHFEDTCTTRKVEFFCFIIKMPLFIYSFHAFNRDTSLFCTHMLLVYVIFVKAM